MSKSYWMKEQNGNFSNKQEDTFDPTNRYIGIRLQQGVPLLDRDWNELEDIRRYEEQMLRKEYIGNGTPDDGFRISALDMPSNDFKISKGRCLVDGFEAVNEPLHFAPLFGMEDSKIEEALNEVEDNIPDKLKTMFQTKGISFSDDATVEEENEDKWVITDNENTFIIRKEENKLNVYPVNFILYSQQKSIDEKLPDLTQPGDADRVDTVYLDVWIEEVRSKDNEDPLNNPDDVKVETCVRHKLEWRVRVAENGNGHYPENHHYHYDIAKIRQEKGNNAISNKYIKDRRRTGLALHLLKDATAVVTQLTNNSIADTLHRHCKLVASDGSPDPALSVDKHGKVGIGTEKPINPLGIRASGTTEELISFEDPTGNTKWHINQNLDGDKPGLNFVETGVADGRLFIEKGGNVGIGTTKPFTKLHIVTAEGADHEGYGNPWVWGQHIEIAATKMWGLSDLHGMLCTWNSDSLFIGQKDEGGDRKDALIAFGDNRNDSLRFMFTPPGNPPPVPEELMRITGKGNVGIGTMDGLSKLTVKGSPSFEASGTVSVLANSKIVEGKETSFTTQVVKGDRIKIKLFQSNVTSIESDVSLELDTPAYCNLSGTMRVYPSLFRVDDSSGSAKLIISDYGKVGINIINPRYTLTTIGTSYATTRRGDGIDYAEYFESLDGKEIPAGTPVVLDSGKIRPAGTPVLLDSGKIIPAKKNEIPIGIISSNSVIVGGVHTEWPKKYIRDDFGSLKEDKEEVMVPKKEKVTRERQKIEKKTVTEEVTRTEIVFEKGKYIQKEISETVTREVEEQLFEEVDLYDASGKNIIGKHQIPVMETYEEEIEILDENDQPVLVGTGEFVTKQRLELDPEYDESQEYVSREQREEWNCVGLLGQLPLRKGKPVAPTWTKIKDISKDVELWLVR